MFLLGKLRGIFAIYTWVALWGPYLRSPSLIFNQWALCLHTVFDQKLNRDHDFPFWWPDDRQQSSAHQLLELFFFFKHISWEILYGGCDSRSTATAHRCDLQPARTSSQERIVHVSSQLGGEWSQNDGSEMIMMGELTLWKLANATSKVCLFFSERWSLNIYQYSHHCQRALMFKAPWFLLWPCCPLQ